MFGSIILDYADNLEALRDFVHLIGPFATQKDTESLEERVFALVPFIHALAQAVPEVSLPEDLGHKFKDALNGDYEVRVSQDDEGERTVELKVSGKSAWNFHRMVRSLKRQHPKTTLLYGSSLITLVSSAEWFVSQLLHKYLGTYPNILNQEEKRFSLCDLLSLGSIDDARNSLIESKVEDIVRGSCQDWIAYIKATQKLTASYLDESLLEIAEVYQRRNLIVHNGGKVNSIYLSKVDEALRQGVQVGDVLSVLPEYLDRAIDLYESNFILLASELWKKLEPTNEHRASALVDIAFHHLNNQRWIVAESLSRFVMGDKQLPEEKWMTGQINYWQSVKWQGRFDEIRADVESADYSAKDVLFRLARLALLDKCDEFFDILPTGLRSGRISPDMISLWPVFRQIRRDPRCFDACKIVQEIESSHQEEDDSCHEILQDRDSAAGAINRLPPLE